jgi:prepilin-type N-terminal cleavage/methylation domain-containing protein
MRALRARLHSTLARESASSDSGFSLVELLVAIAIFVVLAVMISGMMIGVIRATGTNRSIDADTRGASNGMNEVSRIIRAATENPLLSPADGAYPNDPAVQAANLRTVTVYTYVNLSSSAETPMKVMLWVNSNNQLVETRWLGTTVVNGHWTFSATAQPDRVLCDNVVAGTTIFGYLADDGSPVTIPSGGIISNSDLLSIRSITVTLSIKTPLATSSAITLQNSVGMPNLGFSNTSGVTP